MKPQICTKKFQSRLERTRSGLLRSAEICPEGFRQSLITEYYKVLNSFDLVIKKNEELNKFVKYLTDKITSLEDNEDNIAIISDMPKLLQALVKCHIENKDKKKQGRRYKDALVRNFSIFSRDLAGKQSYEFWSSNLPLPSLSTVAVHGEKSCERIIEGQFRFKELVKYLEERGLDKEVWLSEDGTRLKVAIQYDPKTNQLVGFVPKFNDDGLPMIGSFEADSAGSIKKMFETETFANYAYVIMAQPLSDVPPFLVCVFGTDNRFNTDHVLNRWEWTLAEAKKHDLTIMGFSSDGDPKLLAAMKRWTFGRQLMVLPEWKNFFFAPMDREANALESLHPLCIQDGIHIVAKLKTQLLKARNDSNFLPMGQYIVSGTFLHILVQEKSKFDHGLSVSDLDTKDKMNYRSAQKISDDRVINILGSVPGANGTKTYLVMLRGVLDSFLEKNLSVERRMYLVWRTVFFLRYWRSWIQENNYKVKLNFLTANTYQCIEISAHSLVNVYRRCRDSGKIHLFLPWLMSSQPCERRFGDARSFTSSFHTAVNMSMLEFMNKSKKIQRVTETGHELAKEVIVPRHHKKMKEVEAMTCSLRDQDSLDDSQIVKVISESKSDAIALAKELGMICGRSMPEIIPSFIRSTIINQEVDSAISHESDDESSSNESESSSDESESSSEKSEKIPEDVAEDILLQDQDNMVTVTGTANCSLPANSPFVVFEENGKQSVIRKSTLVWYLTPKKHTLSSNRQERVKAAEESLNEAQDAAMCPSAAVVAETMTLGDWTIFSGCPLPNRLYVGRILNFSYLSGSGKGREYSKDSIPTVEPAGKSRGIGCLGDWYTLPLQGNGKFVKYHEPHSYLDAKRYICTVPKPTVVNGTLSYSQDVLTSVKECKKCLQPEHGKDNTKPVRRKLKTKFGSCLRSDSSDTGKNTVKRKAETKSSRCRPSDSSDTEEDTAIKNAKKKSGRLLFPDSSDSEGGTTEKTTTNQIRSRSPRPVSPRSHSPVTPCSSAAVQSFSPLPKTPTEGDFVLVEFAGKNSTKYYVAKVLSEQDKEEDLEVSYLRRCTAGPDKCKFNVPHVPDLASAHISNVKVILPKPTVPAGTMRSQSSYKFDFNFQGLNVC